MRVLTPSVLFLLLVGCGGGSGSPFLPPDDEPQFTLGCLNSVISETDAQAFLQINGAFDQLRHDEGEGNEPIKMTTKIDNFIKTYMCENDIPGLGLGIVWQGNLVYVKGYGWGRGWGTNLLADDEPVRGQRTRFRWASVSKCVTGLAAVMASQDMENGEPVFDLDANLAVNYRCNNEICSYSIPNTVYVGWFAGDDDNPVPWPLDIDPVPAVEDIYDFTPRRLLANRCGVRHYGQGDPALAAGPTEQDKADNSGFRWAVDYWTDEPLVYLPAQQYNYSSYGFNMAGAALEWALGAQTYWEYVQSRIAAVTHPSAMMFFHPDDTNDPQYDGAPWFTTGDRAHGYSQDEDTLQITMNTEPDDVSWKLPSGGFISTTADMALFAEGLLNNRFLNQAGMDLLFTPQEGIIEGGGTPSIGYALGFDVDSQSGERMVHHNGGQQDTSTRLVIFPDGEDPSVGKLGIVVMSNARYLDREFVTDGVEDLLRNPYEEDGSIVFEGLLPRNPGYAAQDAENRLANGPYVDQGLYLDPQNDAYEEQFFTIQLTHRYNPAHEWAPPLKSPDEQRDDPKSESAAEIARRIPVDPPEKR